LESLFRELRWDEFAPTGWTDAVKTGFLASQYDFQQRHYVNAFPDAEHSIVEAAGVPIGQISVDRTPQGLRLIDISLQASWRGRGIGGALVGMLQDEVRAGRVEHVNLSVDRTNPNALRLYLGLGFVEAAPTPTYPQLSIEMIWPAPASPA
jgi:ribosomal protein S18 acetylase RimI-like enzyme